MPRTSPGATPSTGPSGPLQQAQAGATKALAALLSAVDGSETFTATGDGTTVRIGGMAARAYSLQVKATGSVTSWTVVLEVSLDDTNWTTVATHDNSTPGDGLMIASTSDMPSGYVRARCSALTLGAGTDIVTTFRAIS